VRVADGDGVSSLIPTVADIMTKVSVAAFGRPLITNILRGQVAEAIIATALEPQWRWCSGDWSSWDFERGRVRLEVKQSALVQTWSNQAITKPQFDIRERTGYWRDGLTWTAKPGRAADIYVFALHCEISEPDHRDPKQWEFYVVPASRLPAGQKTIVLNSVRLLAQVRRYDDLRQAVEIVSEEVTLDLSM